MKRNRLPPPGLSLLVAIVYFAGAELGLSLATLHQNVTPVWPPVRDVMTFIVYAAVLAPLVSATMGSLSVCFGDPRQWSNFAWLWLTWWMGDGFGALIVSPLLLSAVAVWGAKHGYGPFIQPSSNVTLLLGLAIVRHLIELHGGTVSATNRGEKGGAILTVRLPAR